MDNFSAMQMKGMKDEVGHSDNEKKPMKVGTYENFHI